MQAHATSAGFHHWGGGANGWIFSCFSFKKPTGLMLGKNLRLGGLFSGARRSRWVGERWSLLIRTQRPVCRLQPATTTSSNASASPRTSSRTGSTVSVDAGIMERAQLLTELGPLRVPLTDKGPRVGARDPGAHRMGATPWIGAGRSARCSIPTRYVGSASSQQNNCANCGEVRDNGPGAGAAWTWHASRALVRLMATITLLGCRSSTPGRDRQMSRGGLVAIPSSSRVSALEAGLFGREEVGQPRDVPACVFRGAMETADRFNLLASDDLSDIANRHSLLRHRVQVVDPAAMSSASWNRCAESEPVHGRPAVGPVPDL